jgi:hypothetical protein
MVDLPEPETPITRIIIWANLDFRFWIFNHRCRRKPCRRLHRFYQCLSGGHCRAVRPVRMTAFPPQATGVSAKRAARHTRSVSFVICEPALQEGFLL